MFENNSKCRIWIFELLNFRIFHQLFHFKIDMSGNTVWPQSSGFQKLAKIHHFWHGIFNQLLSTQNAFKNHIEISEEYFQFHIF